MTFTPLGITADMIAALIVGDDAGKPRSQQAAPGPSQLGTPCPRQLAHLIAGTPKISGGGDPLPRWVGTAAHAGMEAILTAHPDWEAEHRVELPGYGIRGTVDAYHRPTKTVLDFKFVGASALRAYKVNGPSQQYRWQAHIYGTGMALQGYEVSTVAIAFIPRSGLTSGIHVWTEPHDHNVTEEALARYETTTKVAKPGLFGLLPTADGPCDWCPWHQPGSANLDTACPGHTEPPTVTGTVTETATPTTTGAR